MQVTRDTTAIIFSRGLGGRMMPALGAIRFSVEAAPQMSRFHRHRETASLCRLGCHFRAGLLVKVSQGDCLTSFDTNAHRTLGQLASGTQSRSPNHHVMLTRLYR